MSEFEKMLRQIICEKSYVGTLIMLRDIAREKAELFAGKDDNAAKIWKAYADRTDTFTGEILMQI
jgi:hypothetical protein